ncbi:MAG: alanine racemase [Longimicrobiales bacterium]
MTLSRRTALKLAAGAGAAALLPGPTLRAAAAPSPTRFDPWVEVDPAALRHNVEVVARLAGGRPILAVIKNNAYGLGLREVAGVLEPLPAVAGFAVVKAEAALALRAAGVRKPVVLMALFDDDAGAELVARGVELALTTDDGVARARRAGAGGGRAARVHVYLDTGMGRMGVPWHRAGPWLRDVGTAGLDVAGTFTAFTENAEFDREQLHRFRTVCAEARAEGVGLGALHAASSNGVFHLPDAHLDQVRPGIALFGAYPSDWTAERAIATLVPAVRLRARVVRVERLRAGDSVSYGRNYVARRPTWIATIPAGHTDGVPRQAVEGMRVLVGDRTYPVIGAVSASHTILEIGDEPTVAVGDVATLLGPDRPKLHPNAIAAATGRSVYDVLMHLSPSLPRILV